MSFEPFPGGAGSEIFRVMAAPPGTRVAVDDEACHIRGTLRFDDDGDSWVEHRLTTAAGHDFWLALEAHDVSPVVTRWDAMDLVHVIGAPEDRQVIFGGTDYERVESSDAAYVANGDVDLEAQGSVEYVDFRARDGRLVCFERYGSKATGWRKRRIQWNEWEAATGRPVILGSVRLL